MKLINVRVTEFQSIRDSNAFDVGDITCLVGKNESGKTALLQALYRLNPIIGNDAAYDITDDYPRWDVEDYRIAVENKTRKPAIVVEAVFKCEQSEIEPIRNSFGPNALTDSDISLSRGYENEMYYKIKIDEQAALKHVIEKAELLPETKNTLAGKAEIEEILAILSKAEKTTPIANLITFLQTINKTGGIEDYIFEKIIQPNIPQFLYFDEYYQMEGHANIDLLEQRKTQNKLKHSDYPLLGLINLSRLNLDELQNPSRTRELKNKLEGAGNHLTKSVLKYWSQNRHLQLRFDVRPARPEDPADMRTGTNIWAEVYDTDHMVTTELGTRSRGFVWFFSFLAWYSDIQLQKQNVILLLDEPGLFLHANGQLDLLRYFEAEIAPKRQLIYTTHSPFMIDPKRYDRVRIVQDLSIDQPVGGTRLHEGTKVLTEVLEATGDSLFPLQGALGYEITQSLFVGPNSLVVEGVSDLLYLQTISGILQQSKRISLDKRWTITPVGGSEKVSTFVALLGAQKELKIATLIDIRKKDQQSIENLYRKKLLKKTNTLTFADFTGLVESDIEDMFDIDFYVELVNAEYHKDIDCSIKSTMLNSKAPRIISKLEEFFRDHPLKNGIQFNHYRPARYFAENSTKLVGAISTTTLDRFENAFKTLNALL